jgi:hypothetical protein
VRLKTVIAPQPLLFNQKSHSKTAGSKRYKGFLMGLPENPICYKQRSLRRGITGILSLHCHLMPTNPEVRNSVRHLKATRRRKGKDHLLSLPVLSCSHAGRPILTESLLVYMFNTEQSTYTVHRIYKRRTTVLPLSCKLRILRGRTRGKIH